MQAIDSSGYEHDGEHRLTLSGAGQYVRTGFWTPALAIPECDPKPPTKVAISQPTPPAPRTAAQLVQTETVPTKAIFVKTTLSEKDLFGFDRYELMPAAMGQLDGVAERIKRSSELDAIQINGYADRIG